MLLALASVKGSPGVTTLALAVAARWPSSARPVLVECDPAGGDIAARFGLFLSPGLISLAAAARRNSDPQLLWEHTQSLPGGLPVIVGPLRPDQARTALTTLAAPDTAADQVVHGAGRVLVAAAGQPAVAVVADCGRLDQRDDRSGEASPVRAVIAAADQLLILVRPQRDELAHLAARAEELTVLARRVALVLAGPGYPAAEVAAEVGLPVFARVPTDARTAARLAGRATGLGWSRAPLPRAAAGIAAALHRPGPTATATPGPGRPGSAEDSTDCWTGGWAAGSTGRLLASGVSRANGHRS